MNWKMIPSHKVKENIKAIERSNARVKTGGCVGPKEHPFMGKAIRHSQSRMKKKNNKIACSHTPFVTITARHTKIHKKMPAGILLMTTLPFRRLSKGVPSRPGKYFLCEKSFGFTIQQ